MLVIIYNLYCLQLEKKLLFLLETLSHFDFTLNSSRQKSEMPPVKIASMHVHTIQQLLVLLASCKEATGHKQMSDQASAVR